MQSSVEGGGIIIEDLDVTGGIDISGDITVSSSAQSIISSRAEADAYGISFEGNGSNTLSGGFNNSGNITVTSVAGASSSAASASASGVNLNQVACPAILLILEQSVLPLQPPLIHR